MNQHLYAVILAGGSGTRFWPLSRHLYPKQLLRILGDKTLIQQTMDRVIPCVPAVRILISTNPVQAGQTRDGLWLHSAESTRSTGIEGRARGVPCRSLCREAGCQEGCPLPASWELLLEQRNLCLARLDHSG